MNSKSLKFVSSKLAYAKSALDANPQREPLLRLFVQWLHGEADPDEVVARLPFLAEPVPPETIRAAASNPNQLEMFP